MANMNNCKKKKHNKGPLKTITYSYYPKTVKRNAIIIGFILAFIAGCIVGKIFF